MELTTQFTLVEADDCVATRVVTSIRHWIVLFCERYWLAGVGGRGWARRTKSGGKDIGDGGGFSVKIYKLSARQSPCCFLIFVCSYLLESKLRIRDEELQGHTNVKWRCWRRPQGHCFFITKTLSTKLCIRYCWRNVVCRRSGRVIIMDKGQDKTAASTQAETSGLLAQDRYCARGSGGGAKKRRGNGKE